MRATKRGLAGFGVGATAGAAVAALFTTGLGGGLIAASTPRAAADELLPAFRSCDELRQWYVDAALPQVGPWGFGGGYPVDFVGGLGGRGPIADQSLPLAATRGTAEDAVGSSDTGTNVQEGGVDEPDIAKTDGSTVYRLQGRRLLVVDVSGSEARQVAELRLPGPRWDQRELLLTGDTVLIVSSAPSWFGGPMMGTLMVDPMMDSVRMPDPWGATGGGTTRLVSVDVSDPTDPTVTSDQRLDGTLVAAREYGDGVVRVVTDSGLPPLDFVSPNRNRTSREATRTNRQVVRDSTLSDWLPGVRVDGDEKRPLLDCTAVRHPEKPAGFGTITVVTLQADQPTDLDAVAVTAAGDLVYSSTDRLYVATQGARWWQPAVFDEVVPRTVRKTPSTQVHAFALDATSTTYVASGEVQGTVRDRWSFSEHEGRLRVATALGNSWNPRENAVSVMEEDGERLEVVGTVAGLGPDESIQSVRWLGDLAVVVTFRQTDPLYTLDLSDPTDPTVIGALKIRGFSAYLHPVGDDQLLGLGRDATRTGRDLGGQAALFDLSDLSDVVRTDTLGLSKASGFSADSEPRSFTYLPEERLALAGVNSWRRGDSRLVAMKVGSDGSLAIVRSWPTRRWTEGGLRALPLGEGRVALVDGGVSIIDVG